MLFANFIKKEGNEKMKEFIKDFLDKNDSSLITVWIFMFLIGAIFILFMSWNIYTALNDMNESFKDQTEFVENDKFINMGVIRGLEYEFDASGENIISSRIKTDKILLTIFREIPTTKNDTLFITDDVLYIKTKFGIFKI